MFKNYFQNYCEPVLVKKNKSVDYVHPLDFFLIKGMSEQRTDEKSIETRSASLRSVASTLSDMLMKIEAEACESSKPVNSNKNIQLVLLIPFIPITTLI